MDICDDLGTHRLDYALPLDTEFGSIILSTGKILKLKPIQVRGALFKGVDPKRKRERRFNHSNFSFFFSFLFLKVMVTVEVATNGDPITTKLPLKSYTDTAKVFFLRVYLFPAIISHFLFFLKFISDN